MKRAVVFVKEPAILRGKIYRWRVRKLPMWHWRSVRLNVIDIVRVLGKVARFIVHRVVRFLRCAVVRAWSLVKRTCQRGRGRNGYLP